MRLLRLLNANPRVAATILGVALMPTMPAVAQPGYKLIRYEEDWTMLRDPSRHSSSLDKIKYISLGWPPEGSYLSLGGETRQRYEYFRNPSWGLDPQDGNGFFLQRYMLHADLHLGARFRLFGQLKSGIATGRTGGPRPPDEDKLDIHQAFLETHLWAPADTSRLSVRAGRQEVNLGSSRLVSIREGPNVRQSFDGLRLTLDHSKWSIQALALRPAETNPGILDDSPNRGQSIWGVYSTGPLRIAPGSADFYYLGLDRSYHEYDQGGSHEQRQSLGARWFVRSENWDCDYEAVWQFGDFGPARIRAWTVASNTGYTWPTVSLHPRLGLKADVASGDRNPHDRTLGTFNALYPKGAYFSQADLLGPYNIMDLHPSLTLKVARTVTLSPDADFFWRQSTRDGIYDTPGNLLVSGKNAGGRYIGAHASLGLEWQANRNLSFEAQYLHFFPGRFLKEVSLDRQVNFLGVWATFKF